MTQPQLRFAHIKKMSDKALLKEAQALSAKDWDLSFKYSKIWLRLAKSMHKRIINHLD